MAEFVVEYVYRPKLDKISDGLKDEALGEIADFILETVLENTGNGQSSAGSGGSWAELSPEYKKQKDAAGYTDEANLERTGDMLSALKTEIDGEEIRLFVEEGEQSAKADGHCNHSGSARKWQKPRIFVPKPKQKFSPDILEGIRDIISNYEEASKED